MKPAPPKTAERLLTFFSLFVILSGLPTIAIGICQLGLTLTEGKLGGICSFL